MSISATEGSPVSEPRKPTYMEYFLNPKVSSLKKLTLCLSDTQVVGGLKRDVVRLH